MQRGAPHPRTVGQKEVPENKGNAHRFVWWRKKKVEAKQLFLFPPPLSPCPQQESDMLQVIELGIQRTFAALARASAARPLLISLSTLFVLIGLGFGILNIEVETDVLKLWVDDSTSLIDVRANKHNYMETHMFFDHEFLEVVCVYVCVTQDG